MDTGASASNPPTLPRVEFFLLADRAEITGGKLYVMGGLVDQFSVSELPTSLHFGFALSVLSPDDALDQPMAVGVSFASPDGRQLATLEAVVTVQRSTLPFGASERRAALAFPQVTLMVSEEGRHGASVSINGGEAARLTFSVQRIPE